LQAISVSASNPLKPSSDAHPAWETEALRILRRLVIGAGIAECCKTE